MMHEDTPSAGWHTAHGRQQQQQQRHPPLAAATSLQSLLQTNPGILKTIQPNDASGLLLCDHLHTRLSQLALLSAAA